MKDFHKLRLRDHILRSIRFFFWNEHFTEVETPLLVPSVIPESYLSHFSTFQMDRFRNMDKKFLTASPEASLKKLLVEGIGDCFEITRSFRNGETDATIHRTEFTILEWYRVNRTYEALIQDCERLFQYIVLSLGLSSPKISYNQKLIDLSSPWQIMTVKEAFELYANISLDEITRKDATTLNDMFPVKLIQPFAEKRGYVVGPKNTWEEIFNQIFLNDVEPKIANGEKPLILKDYPKPLAALATEHPDDPRLCQRFEIYVGGLEIGDAYNELRDPVEQKIRFAQELERAEGHGKTQVKPDLEFIQALEKGLPECAGIAIGVDRLAMLFTDSRDISEVLWLSK